LVELVFLFELFAEINVFGNRFVVGKRPLHGDLQLVHFERLFQVIVSAVFHRFDGRFDGTKTRNHDNYRRRIEAARFLQNFQALFPGLIEIQIRDDQFGLGFFQGGYRGLRVVERKNLVSIRA